MIGNDIIDLELAATQSNWKRRGFLTKIFTEAEHDYILNSDNSFHTVWQLWSMKESAYKAHLQQYPKRFFNPKKLICVLKKNNEGSVTINTTKYRTKTQQTKDCIHTIATEKKAEVRKECFQLSKADTTAQSFEVRQRLLSEVAEIKGVSRESLWFMKNEIGAPKVYQNGSVLEHLISLSHHGRFGAFTIA